MVTSSRQLCLVVVAAAGSFLSGCAATEQPSSTAERVSVDTLMKLGVAPLDHSQLEWAPGTGRMDRTTRARHVASDAAPLVLWDDDFGRGEGSLPGEWTTVDEPRVSPFRMESLAGIEIEANGQNAGECELERHLSPASLRGQTVRLSLELACPSPRRLETLRNVRLSVAARDDEHGNREVSLPMAAEVSPGWETLSWWLHFGREIESALLRVHLVGADAGLIVRRMTMTAYSHPGSAAASAPASTPTVNLIAGGDFETGRRMFIASHLHGWPNADPTAGTLACEYVDEAAVGEKCLKMLIPAGTGRIGFGPLDLNASASWHLKLHAKTSQAATITVSLRGIDRTIEKTTFAAGPEWKAFTHEFRLNGESVEQARWAAAELIIDVPASGADPLECWLDAVSLTNAAAEAYLPPEAIEVGITGPAPLTTDLANIVSDDETTSFTVNLKEYSNAQTTQPATLSPVPAPPAGKLALDVLDAWDRTVWSRTVESVMSREGEYSETVRLRLPRGYYRLLASLWSGEPGQSRLISQDSSAVAVVSFKDPVPLGNRYGLTAANDNISGYTTALGAGWVRVNVSAQKIETGPGAWDFGVWQPGLTAAKQADVELLAAVGLPTVERYWRVFLEQLLANSPLQPIGLVFNPPLAATRPAEECRKQLEWAAEVLSPVSPHARLVFDLSAVEAEKAPGGSHRLPAVPNLVLGYAATHSPLPERSEPLLEKIGRSHGPDLRVWDLGVPARLGGNRDELVGSVRPGGKTAEPVALVDPPVDPALSASHMVRSVLIRALTGAQLVCSEAVALDPPRSLFQASGQRLHECDLSPRPALVAYERMTSLLNDATLVRWIDQPDGCRILHFEKDDGGSVAAVWRPFGASPTFLSLAGLPSNIEVLDCFGMPEPILMNGHVRLIAANEMVRYVVAAPEQAALLAEAIDASRVRPGPAQSRPDR